MSIEYWDQKLEKEGVPSGHYRTAREEAGAWGVFEEYDILKGVHEKSGPFPEPLQEARFLILRAIVKMVDRDPVNAKVVIASAVRDFIDAGKLRESDPVDPLGILRDPSDSRNRLYVLTQLVPQRYVLFTTQLWNLKISPDDDRGILQLPTEEIISRVLRSFLKAKKY